MSKHILSGYTCDLNVDFLNLNIYVIYMYVYIETETRGPLSSVL